MVEGELIYLACPYSEGDATEALMEKRFKQVTNVTAYLTKQGCVIFSPITHSHIIKKAGDLPNTWDFWWHIDSIFLSKCDGLWVLMLDGWDLSIGVQEEIKFADKYNIPIKYLKIDIYGFPYDVNIRE